MKIPPEAKRVFKGIIFDVYQWQQKMFDGSGATFEMLKRPNTIGVIAIKDGKICVSVQSQPNHLDFYSLFGGRAEENEEPLATAKRELLEESGLVSDNWGLYKSYRPAEKIDWEIYIYVARDCKKTEEMKLDSGEKIEMRELGFEEFVDFILSEKCNEDELKMDILKMKVNDSLKDFETKLLG
jgi:ADP-ribose pyrophosphatase